ncbi:MAG: TetR/AcrR family transcriptional regulator [Myxococcales bacterium]|nr:TetR/AcrR family transcriptional regulator [Myxococcales bacterium]
MFVPRSEGQSRVLRAARALVRRRGHAQCSLREIAAAAGYSPAGLYAHFAGRDAILAAVADELRLELTDLLEQAGRGVKDPVKRLVAFGLGYVAFAATHPAEFELLYRWTPPKRRHVQDLRESPIDVVRATMREVTTSDRAAELASFGLWATAHGLAGLRASFPGSDEDYEARCAAVLRAQIERAERDPA